MAKGMQVQSILVLELYCFETVSAGKVLEQPELATSQNYVHFPHIKIICDVFKMVNHQNRW